MNDIYNHSKNNYVTALVKIGGSFNNPTSGSSLMISEIAKAGQKRTQSVEDQNSEIADYNEAGNIIMFDDQDIPGKSAPTTSFQINQKQTKLFKDNRPP